jgi:hypothetical protein
LFRAHLFFFFHCLQHKHKFIRHKYCNTNTNTLEISLLLQPTQIHYKSLLLKLKMHHKFHCLSTQTQMHYKFHVFKLMWRGWLMKGLQNRC